MTLQAFMTLSGSLQLITINSTNLNVARSPLRTAHVSSKYGARGCRMPGALNSARSGISPNSRRTCEQQIDVQSVDQRDVAS